MLRTAHTNNGKLLIIQDHIPLALPRGPGRDGGKRDCERIAHAFGCVLDARRAVAAADGAQLSSVVPNPKRWGGVDGGPTRLAKASLIAADHRVDNVGNIKK